MINLDIVSDQCYQYLVYIVSDSSDRYYKYLSLYIVSNQ